MSSPSSNSSSDRLTRDDVRHVALLCRINLSEDEVGHVRDRLSRTLEQFRTLADIDTTNVEPTGHSVDLDTVMRPDNPGSSMTTQEVMSNAPHPEGEFFRVHAVLEEHIALPPDDADDE